MVALGSGSKTCLLGPRYISQEISVKTISIARGHLEISANIMIDPRNHHGTGRSQSTGQLEPCPVAECVSEFAILSTVDDEATLHSNLVSSASTLANLPNELFDHVLDFLDRQSPSELNWHQRPDLAITKSTEVDLKNLSVTSKSIRRLVLKRLFVHVCLDPNESPAFLEFVDQYALAPHIRSILARMTEPCRLILHPLWWARLLNEIPALTFTIICPPYVFAEFVSTTIVDMDTWAFNMPFQVIRFRQPKLAAIQHTSFNDDHDLFSARPWSEFSINEGSCLKVYSQYEYFFRRTPSLMSTALLSPSPGINIMFAKLEKFSYTAIFPFYNHVDVILKNIRKMSSLKHLNFRLCPDPGSSVIDDELADSNGHIDLSDAWMEFNTAYSLVAHTARFIVAEYTLQEFQVEDVSMDGIRDGLIDSLDGILAGRMSHQGGGLWRKTQPIVKKERTPG
jgi:hypothetical protein